MSVLTLASPGSETDVVDGRLFSKAPGVEKAYRVYLPANYELGDRAYPVIFLLHEWGVTERLWTDTLKVHEIAEHLKLEAQIVMTDGDRSLYANVAAAVDYQVFMVATSSIGDHMIPIR